MATRKITEEDIENEGMVDPLKRARRELVLRQIRNEDLKMAVAEGQLMRTEIHHEALSEIVSSMITFLDTLPDVLERKLALESVVVIALRDAVDKARDNLHEKLVELLAQKEDASVERSGSAFALDKPLPPPKAGKRRPGRPTNAEKAMRGEV